VASKCETLTIYSTLIAKEPNVPEHRERRAVAGSTLGRLMYKRGQVPEARTTFSDSIRDFEESRRLAPDDVQTRDGLASCLVHFGDMLWETEDRQEARAKYKEALELRETLTTETEHVCRLANFLCNCLDAELGDLQNTRKAVSQFRRIMK